MTRFSPKKGEIQKGLRVIKTQTIPFIDVERTSKEIVTISFDANNLAIALDWETALQIAREIIRRSSG